MLKYIYLFLFISFVIVCQSCSEDPSSDPLLAFEEFDNSYGSDPLQDYDIFLPANRTTSSTHVIILVHGGGWTGGDKEDVDELYKLIKARMPEYAVVNMNYRLTLKADDPFIDQLTDVDLVIRDLDRQSEDFQISDLVALIGVSAGGHMVLQHSYANNGNGNVRAVGNIIGPTYFLDDSYTMTDILSLQFLVASIVQATGVPFTNEPFYDAISPLKAVDANSVPTIQFFGAEDPLVPTTQGTLLKEKLDEFGIPNELTIYEGEGHGWSDLNNWVDTFNKFDIFVDQYIESN